MTAPADHDDRHDHRVSEGAADDGALRGRARHRRGAPRIALVMTPMIDVVFLLLVYFMAATDFRAAEAMYPMDLPSREGLIAQDPFRLEEEPLRIAVASAGLSADLYKLRIDGPYSQPATFEELFEFLRDRQVNPHVGGGLFTADHPIVIQPTRSTRWEHAMEAFNAAARARYTNVTFAKPQ